VILGASFDTVEENRAFAEAQQFPYRLLSDVDRKVGEQYGVIREPGNPLPRRNSFLIDPTGVIRRVYEVSDVKTHPDEVLNDIVAGSQH
jgi:thioredoxin-dependent peroxiredoxin